VADAFDAMLNNSGTQFDPETVEAFLSTFDNSDCDSHSISHSIDEAI